jgi:hypothetical protein
MIVCLLFCYFNSLTRELSLPIDLSHEAVLLDFFPSEAISECTR